VHYIVSFPCLNLKIYWNLFRYSNWQSLCQREGSKIHFNRLIHSMMICHILIDVLLPPNKCARTWISVAVHQSRYLPFPLTKLLYLKYKIVVLQERCTSSATHIYCRNCWKLLETVHHFSYDLLFVKKSFLVTLELVRRGLIIVRYVMFWLLCLPNVYTIWIPMWLFLLFISSF